MLSLESFSTVRSISGSYKVRFKISKLKIRISKIKIN